MTLRSDLRKFVVLKCSNFSRQSHKVVRYASNVSQIEKVMKIDRTTNARALSKRPISANLQMAILIHQSQSLSKDSPLLPRYVQLLPHCVSHWKARVPNWEHLYSTEGASIYTGSSFPAALCETLAKTFNFNQKLASFIDVCVLVGEVELFLRLLNSLRREMKNIHGLDGGTFVVQPQIYETIVRHFSSKADWLSLDALFKRMEQDGIPLNRSMFQYGLECLGRLLLQASSSLQLPPFVAHAVPKGSVALVLPPKHLPTPEEIIGKIDHILESFILNAEKKGLNLFEGLLELPRRGDTLEYILTALFHARPHSSSVSLSYIPSSIDTLTKLQEHNTVRIYPVQRYLLGVTHNRINPFAEVVPSKDGILEAFERQFALEIKGEVRIEPVLPPFSTLDTDRAHLPEHLRKQLVKSLLAEQHRWRGTLTTAFKDMLQRLKRPHSRGKITVYPYLKILPVADYVELMVKGIDAIALDTTLQHVSSYLVCLKLGERVENACNLYRKKKLGILSELREVYTTYAVLFNQTPMEHPEFRHMWLHSMQNRVHCGVSLHQDWPAWTASTRYAVGRVLYELIYDRLTFNRLGPSQVRRASVDQNVSANPKLRNENITKRAISPGLPREDSPVLFDVLAEYPHELRKEVKIHPTLANWYRDADYPPLSFHPAELPMLCPPVPWTDLNDAGYLMSTNYATRLIRQSHVTASTDPALSDDLDFNPKSIPAVLDALNCLASCPWRVNETILDYLIQVARSGGKRKLSMPELGKALPLKPLRSSKNMTYEERRAAHRHAREARKIFDETRSLWASELYRLSIANQYRGQVFWLPHSLDFRGRVYPCPPHFHHMGSDIARGLITFAKGLPLGERGLDWLKIHLVNLTGLRKRSSNAERLEFANSLIDDITDSAENPFTGHLWWQDQEEPWQTLACCREITAALHHPEGPKNFVSRFPVHQDGSCNGLQHYAALGRDQRGAESVNLCNLDRPQDVYGDVVEVVEAQRRVDAAAGMPAAQVLEGFVRRKVIKQSVMTTVYGVTLYGATEQIRRQLRDIDDFPNKSEWAGPAASYLARVTLSSIGAIFTSSTDIQQWFGQLARHISQNLGVRVCWETPLGLPVIQPYMKLPDSLDKSINNLYTTPSSPLNASLPPLEVSALQLASQLRDQRTSGYNLPAVNPVKQCNAFPPNFIHSLDSCHMMLTALHCLREGITFASVHDCFWTHAATVDVMNRICREEFIALHTEPILQNFSDYLRAKFAYSKNEIEALTCEQKRDKALSFNELLDNVPKQGSFDLSEIRNSAYFFS